MLVHIYIAVRLKYQERRIICSGIVVERVEIRGGCSFADIGGIVDHHCLNFFFTSFKFEEGFMFLRKKKQMLL